MSVELVKLDLSKGTGGRSGQRVYTAPSGVVVTSSAPTYSNSYYYYMEYLFSATNAANAADYWLTSGGSPVTLTFDLRALTRRERSIRQIDIYPKTRSDSISDYVVSISEDGRTYENVTGNIINTYSNTAYGVPNKHQIDTDKDIQFIRITLAQKGSWGVTLGKVDLFYNRRVTVTPDRKEYTLSRTRALVNFTTEDLIPEKGTYSVEAVIGSKRLFYREGLSGNTADSFYLDPYEFKNAVKHSLEFLVYSDDGEEVGYKEVKVTISNTSPTVTIQVNEDNYVTALIEDSQKDSVKYKVEMNGVKVFPFDSEFTEFLPVPVEYSASFISSQLEIGKVNKLTITVIDEFGGETKEVHPFTPDYIGLLFQDEVGGRYSTDLGEILKLLIMEPNIMAGASTLPAKVYVVNKYMFPVTEVRLYTDNQLEHTKVLFSKTETPFTADEEINMGGAIYHRGEGFYFYVRIASYHPALSGGEFDIVVEAKEVD